jgi:hypothetical protein
MKRYSMLSVLWLVACGAGGGQGDDSSTLAAPLTAEGDDTADRTELASADEPGDDAQSDDDVWTDSSDCDTPGSPAPQPGTVGGGSSSTGPGVVIGAGGQAWTAPANGGVVWCHADVPIGCPAISPVPDGGRLVVVQAPTDAGPLFGAGTAQAAGSAASEPVAGQAGGGEATEVAGVSETAGAGAGTAAGGSGVAGGTASGGGTIIFVDAMPAPGTPPGPPLPVVIGGSLPPLPGTCVAVSFGAAGEGGVAIGEGEVSSVPAGQPAPPGYGPLPPNAGTSPSSGPVPRSTGVAPGEPHPAPPPGLPPPGLCLGVSFPAPPSDVPSVTPVPGEPSTGGTRPNHHGAATMPSGAGACLSVAFAAPADPNSPAPPASAVPPVMCAMPGAPMPGSGAPAPAAEPSAANEPARDDEVR